MAIPIILLCGEAGSGKDTVADFIVQDHRAVKLAFADPMKRFAKDVFGFTDDQLWGPSELRNAPDERYATGQRGWDEAALSFVRKAQKWLASILPPTASKAEALTSLNTWFEALDRTQTLTPRHVLQTLGTEWGRKVSPNLWADVGIRTATELLSNPNTSYDRAVGVVPAKHRATPMVVIVDGRFQNEIIAVKSIGGVAVKIAAPGEVRTGAEAFRAHPSETEQRLIPIHFFDFVFENHKSKGLVHCQSLVGVLVNRCIPAPTWTWTRNSPWERY